MRKVAVNILFFLLGFMASAGVLTASAWSNGKTAFFDSLYDVPVMPGLHEMPEYALVFDKPEGRVAEAAAMLSDDLGPDDVISFYTASLPQLGWAQSQPATYVRGAEKLTILARTHDGKQVVFFLLEPR